LGFVTVLTDFIQSTKPARLDIEQMSSFVRRSAAPVTAVH
jgi:hypothetical protein